MQASYWGELALQTLRPPFLDRHVKRWGMGEGKNEHLEIFKNAEKPPSDEGMMGVLHDHFMLAECDFVVLSHSSFSGTALGVGIHSIKTYTSGEKCSLEMKKRFNTAG